MEQLYSQKDEKMIQISLYWTKSILQRQTMISDLHLIIIINKLLQ